MDHSVVPFSGEGWPANASLTDRLCGPAAANGLRACNFRGFVKTDGMGRFTTSRTVFHSFRYFDFGTPTMDCRVQACDWVFSDPGGATRSVPLTFVPFF